MRSLFLRVIAILCLVDLNSHQFFFDREIHGTPTSISKYPHLAQLLLDSWGTEDFVQHCAGVILTSRHVLSAAHCFQYNANTRKNYSQTKYWKVRVGSTFRTRGGATHKVKSLILHKDFDKYYYSNDIAIVVVTKKIIFNNHVQQCTIIKQDIDIRPDSLCQLVGWGVLEPDGPQPDQLEHTTLTTIDSKTCEFRYSTIGAIIHDNMLCAGRIDAAGPDGCFGDPGGPLMYKGLVVGLVSYGFSCGHRYFPSVFTKVSHFTNWIVKQVRNNK